MKSYKKMIAALAVSSMMLASMGPVWTVAVAAPASKETKEQKEKTIADLDANLLKTAQTTMRQLAGKDIELDSASEYDGVWFIYPKEGKEKGQVVIDEKTGKVTSAGVELSFEELNADMKKHALDALTKIEASKKFTFDRVSRSISNFGKSSYDGIVLTFINGKDASIYFEDNKLIAAAVKYDQSTLDAKVRQAAEQAVKDFAGRTFQISEAWRGQGSGDDTWSLQSESTSQGSISVVTGAQTGKVWSIHNSYEMTSRNVEVDKKLLKGVKEQDALKAAAPAAKEVCGIDLKGYTVKRDKDIPNLFLFTKKGQPTVEVEVSLNKKLSMMGITPAKGGMN